MKICTEADYLQAHLTVIAGESRGHQSTLYIVKQWVTSVLEKWILGANANLTAQSNSLLRLRAISVSQRFGTGSDLLGKRSGFPPPGGTSRRGKQS